MTDKEILAYLDRCDFPMLDNGYYYHVDQQLSVLQDNSEWVMILQILAFNNHELDVNGVTTIVYTYGSFIEESEALTDKSFYKKASNHEIDFLVEETEMFDSYLNPKAKHISVNDQLVPIEHDRIKYREKGIELEDDEKIRPWEYLRFIAPKYAEKFWINREELREKIPLNMKEIITLKNWNHPDNIETGPSDMDTFQILARMLYEEDYEKVEILQNEPGNTHWKNWPMGGTL